MSTEQEQRQELAPPKTALQRRVNEVKALLDEPAYKKRFEEILGKRAAQFMASIVNVSQQRSFDNVRPSSILAAAVVAATLDLPIDRNLGFAWIIPYGGLAQFQMGYKGFVQLALRTNQYNRMNTAAVNEEAFKGFDDVGEPIINWAQIDESKPAIGYAFAYRLVGGFTKTAFWSKQKVLAHAEKYSQAYRAHKTDSPWFTDFTAMALKTVLMNTLRRWGLLSIEMQFAIVRDQSAQADVDAEPSYIDTEAVKTGENGGGTKTERLTEKLKQRNLAEQAGAKADQPQGEETSSKEAAETNSAKVSPQTEAAGPSEEQPAASLTPRADQKRIDQLAGSVWLEQIKAAEWTECAPRLKAVLCARIAHVMQMASDATPEALTCKFENVGAKAAQATTSKQAELLIAEFDTLIGKMKRPAKDKKGTAEQSGFF